MKKPLLIFTLLFSTLMFSTPSYGEWTEVSSNVYGDPFYVDFERIRKHGGYVYFWILTDFLKPKYESLSNKSGKEWGYTSPDSVMETVLKSVCSK